VGTLSFLEQFLERKGVGRERGQLVLEKGEKEQRGR